MEWIDFGFPGWTDRGERWGLSYGDRVIKDLVSGIIDFCNPDPNDFTKPSRKYYPVPVAVGVVYRFTSLQVANALPRASCIVVNKDSLRDDGCQRLLTDGERGVYTRDLGMENLGRLGRNGEPPEWNYEFNEVEDGWLEPVRLAGWSGRRMPLVHSKVLVLGWAIRGYDMDEGPTRTVFSPRRAWLGSANWTSAAANLHSEFGMWTHIDEQVNSLTRYVMSMIRRSEAPASPASPTPRPELGYPDWPDPDPQLMAELMWDEPED